MDDATEQTRLRNECSNPASRLDCWVWNLPTTCMVGHEFLDRLLDVVLGREGNDLPAIP